MSLCQQFMAQGWHFEVPREHLEGQMGAALT